MADDSRVIRDRCPVCRHPAGSLKWVIPFERFADKVRLFGVMVGEIATANDDEPATYYQCENCRSVFLNPLSDNLIHTGTHYIEKMDRVSEWRGYRERYDEFRSHKHEGPGVFLDVAAGVGQYATLAHEHPKDKWFSITAFEGNQRYVDHMAATMPWCNAQQIDLNDPPDDHPLEGLVTFAVFSEAFEHMVYPCETIDFIFRMLAPEGILCFSAQAMGAHLPVRPDETIYSTMDGLNSLLYACGGQVITSRIKAGRHIVVATKPDRRPAQV